MNFPNLPSLHLQFTSNSVCLLPVLEERDASLLTQGQLFHPFTESLLPPVFCSKISTFPISVKHPSFGYFLLNLLGLQTSSMIITCELGNARS